LNISSKPDAVSVIYYEASSGLDLNNFMASFWLLFAVGLIRRIVAPPALTGLIFSPGGLDLATIEFP